MKKGEIMFKTCISIILTLLLVSAFLGCSGAFQGQIDENWGRSYESTKYSQILDPAAEKNLKPVVGLEGRASEKIVGRYIAGEKNQGGSASPGFGVLTIKQ